MHRRSRSHVAVFIFLGLALLLTGCPKRPAMTQAVAPAPAAPTPAPPPPAPAGAAPAARPTSARGHSGASDPGSRPSPGLPAEPCPQGGVFRLRQEPDSAG